MPNLRFLKFFISHLISRWNYQGTLFGTEYQPKDIG